MNLKHLFLLAVLVAAALGIGKWGYETKLGGQRGDALGARLSFEHDGTVAQLFQTISEKSGVKYEIDPKVAERRMNGAYKNASIVQIQADAAKKAHLRYKPLGGAGDAVGVESSN